MVLSPNQLVHDPGLITGGTLDEVVAPYLASLPRNSYTPSTATDFFSDTPWGNIPIHRRANLYPVSRFPKLGLLGGSAKPSKLAALAAARKKREEERQVTAQATQTGRSIALLDRLGPAKENVISQAVTPSAKRASTEQPLPARTPTRPKKEPSPIREKSPVPVPVESSDSESSVEIADDLRARPSMFAQTMFGQRAPSTGGVALQLEEMDIDPPVHRSQGSMFPLPYANDPEFATRDPFSGPSPDDVVLRAQSKGPARV